MKMNESYYQPRWDQQLDRQHRHRHHVVKRETGPEISIVLVAVKTAGEAIKAKFDNWKTMVENITCDVQEEADIRSVWTETVLVLHFYLSSSVVLSYIKSCEDVMRNQAKALLEAVGTADAVELVNDAKEYILSDLHQMEVEDDTYHDDDPILDPESSQNEQLKDIAYLVANNIAHVHEFSDILMSFNSSAQRSVEGVEDLLDETMNSYLIVESMLDVPNVRKKRSGIQSFSKKSAKAFEPIIKLNKIKNKYAHTKFTINDVNKQKVVEQVHEFQNNYVNAKSVAQKHLPQRIRRSIDTESVVNGSIVFVKNEVYPCKLLSFQEERLMFKHYDELLLTTQMWIWSEGYLQHYETGLFLHKTNNKDFVMSADIPNDKLTFSSGWLRYEQDRRLICANDTHDTLLFCKDAPQAWTFVTVETAQSSIASIACLFFIQSIDTCLVLTSVGSESESLEMRSTDYDSVDNQLWYQDFEYIRLARNHEYLARHSENGISLMNSRDDTLQRWTFINNILINVGDENTVFVPSIRQPYMESFNDVQNISDVIYQTRRREIHEADLQNCGVENQLFFITNDDASCKLLCAKQELIDPSPALRFGLPFAAFATGFIAGLFTLCCFDTKEAILTSVAVGVALAIIYTVVVEVAKLLYLDVTIAYFDEYEYNEFEKCIWHQISGTLENMHFGKFLQVDEINSINSLILSEESHQTWYFRNKSIIKSDMSCGLMLTETVADNTDGTLLATSCSREQDKYMIWNRVLIDNSTDFFQEIKCLYFLKSTDKKSCGVLTVKTDSNYSETSVILPTPNNLLEQLWYMENNSMVSLTFDNISVSSNNGLFASIPFKENDIDFQNAIACENGRFFIKSESAPCKVLSVSDSGSLLFINYNHNTFMHQLWSWEDNKLKNIGSDKYLSCINNNVDNCKNLIVSNSSEYKWTIATKKIMRSDSSCYFAIEYDEFDVPFLVCQADKNVASNWSVTYFDENFNFAEDVLCPFFIQDQTPPCGYLVGNKTSGRTLVGPMSKDLINHQLWYRSGDVVFHLESGLPLDIVNAHLTLFNGQNDSNVATAKVIKQNNTDFLRLSYGDNTQITVGRIIAFDSAVNYDSETSCPRTFFFLKNSKEPCKVATPVITNNLVAFNIFDEKRFEEQLWYSEFNRIVNVHSGKVLSLFQAANGNYLVHLVELLFLDDTQIFYADFSMASEIQVTANINETHTCALEFMKNEGFVECTISTKESTRDLWTSVDYETALNNMNDIMCLFYIRSGISPCEFIAGYENGHVLVRPATEELIANQVFYWKDNFIIHQSTGLLLSGDVGTMTVSLQQENQLYEQQWSIHENNLVAKGNTDIIVEFSTHEGNVILKSKPSMSALSNWIFVPIHYDFEKDNITYPQCYTDEETDLSPFFLFLPGDTKLVLTSGNLGEEAFFETFSSTSIESQLWVFQNDHIINLGTGLALMVDEDKDELTHDIIMWHAYSYSSTQRWYVRNDKIYCQLRKMCYLNTASSEKTLTVNANCQTVSSNVQMVQFDTEGNYISVLTSMFFIKNMHPPCELLTAHDDGSLKMRPITETLVENQMWFWKGNQIINFKTNLALQHLITGRFVYLHIIDSNEKDFQEWIFENTLLKPKNADDFFVSVRPDDGVVVLTREIEGVYGQWVFVARALGLDDPDRLHCDSVANNDLYLIRSEHDDCPLLSVYGENNVGYRGTDKEISQSSVWIRRGQHICSANSGHCLSAKRNDGGTPIYTEQRYAFEKYQKWERIGSRISSMDSNLKVTYTGSAVRLYNDNYNSDNRQVWKWYTNNEIEKDDKLLRCSRCYNKKEETAAEVISYIPIFSWLYNIGRSIAYGVKNCPKVALAALRDGLIDLAIDIIVLVSAGTASALAYGIKTGIKLGFKLGIKAFTQALKAMLKNAVRAIKNGVINFVKGGIRNALKRSLSKMRLNIKRIVDGLKRIPHTLKTIPKATISNFKTFIKKGLKSLSIASVRTKDLWKQGIRKSTLQLKNMITRMPSVLKNKLSKLGKSVKRRLKTFADMLSDKAEAAIKKADDIKTAQKKLRCKRMNVACIAITDEDRMKPLVKYETKPFPDMRLPDNLKTDMDFLVNKLKNDQNIKGQSAIVGIKKDGQFVKTDSVAIDTLRENNIKPFDHNNNLILDDAKVNVRHTEQHLFEEIQKDVIEKCAPKSKPCEVFLFTKLSPCFDRVPSAAKTCMKYMTETCREWFTKFAIKCNIGFQTFYGTDAFNKNWNNFFKSKIKHEPGVNNDYTKKLDEVFPTTDERKVFDDMIEKHFNTAVDDASKSLDNEAAGVLKTTQNDLGSFYNSLHDKVSLLDIEEKLRKGLEDKIVTKVAQKLREKLNAIGKERMVYDAIDKIAGAEKDAIRFFLA